MKSEESKNPKSCLGLFGSTVRKSVSDCDGKLKSYIGFVDI